MNFSSSLVAARRFVSVFLMMLFASSLVPLLTVSAVPVSPQDGVTPAEPVEAEVTAETVVVDSTDQPAGESALPGDDPGDSGEDAIRAAIDSYVKAFNDGDAKALAGHFTSEGELVTPRGKTLRGRAELESGFGAYFEESPQAKLELVGTRIDQISPGVAIESGIARVIVPDQEPSETVYEAIHRKTAEGWKIDRSRDDESSESTFSNREQLEGLDWMIGTWVDESDEATIKTTSRWTKNGHFIVRSFKVSILTVALPLADGPVRVADGRCRVCAC
jgi:uncharacterized protein (TIGR02246 family)